MGNAHGSVKEKIDIRRLHTEIGKVLEKLKRTPWKKVDGSFKKYVKDGLKHLDNAYEKLDHPQFEKAQNDITKAIIEAKIISNICSVLTFLFKENRELSVSHKYDGISSIATRILCNYANAEEFAIEVANCPGFLEFICELLAESSENFLQIDTQETKLKDRIYVFIKIASNISNFPRNIPRLRTLNFRAALEPYLKANDADILDTTIDILTRIKVGEVFETNGITSEDATSSQITAPNWLIVVEKITGLISNELKYLHDIEWKEENGAYKTIVMKSLRLIVEVYLELERRNAPKDFVLQSQKEIASVLIDTNIIPKICGVLTDVHLHTLEITDNERNEILNSRAHNILCNCACTSDKFAEHLTNIPGFLEFVNAKLTSASEKILQVDKKETKLKDRIDVFIKIVSCISVSPTNIPRLRTLNFTAALEPYLKANDVDILDTTIDILARIKVGEVFETNGVTSEDASSSQITAPNWPIVVEKITGLISNELKDLHDIEWKEKSGAYKTNVMKSLRLIVEVYLDLERRNAPKDFVMQLQKEIASVLIDANILPKICGVLTDVHLHTMEITENERNEILSSDAHKILCNCACTSGEFAEHLANIPGFFEFVNAKLTSASEEILQLDKKEIQLKDRIDVFIKIVGNISNYPTNIPRLRTCNFTAALEPYLKANDGVILNTTINTLTMITIGELFETKGITSEGTPSSQPAAPNWQTVVERVTGLISNEMKDLHDIEWKEENGAYKTNILKSVRLIDKVYYALETRNVPQEYVMQSRKDIASVLIDANIIPKICGVLKDLHHHTLEITDSERNEMLSSDAQRILCNYTYASDDFPAHVANSPGFLEFIRAKLTSASEAYLQLDKKETILKARIDVFFKIVGKISYSPTNIPRLRTINFTAALEPYLKANDGVILNTTINVLTRMKIGEVFETNGNTSEDTSSSQSAAPNWQTVADRVTTLISIELKDLHNIEWKEENGAYNTKILMSFNLIHNFPLALQTRNAPAVYIKQSKKDIASVLIDANIIPKICGVLTDLHHHTAVITDIRNKILSPDAQKILWNNSDSSLEFAKCVANVPGFLEFIMAKLALEGRKKLEDPLTQFCVGIVNNISKLESCRTQLRSIGTIDVIKPYLKSRDYVIQLAALAALAAITSEDESEIIKSNAQSVIHLMNRLRQGLKTVIRRARGWSCEECALTIRLLARNDANKKLLVQLGALELLVELSKGDENEQTESVRALWDLSFDEDNRMKMMTEEKLELISVLDKMKASDNKLISEAAYGTLWNLRDLLQNSKLERFRNIAKSMMTARESSLPDVSRELKPEGHIMISYQLSHQKTLLMIKEELDKKGFKVWMDVDLMAGSILQATAEAVENADIVLICLSNKYKNSKSCRREVEYADRLDKMIVPLQLEEGYRPDGWLGLIAGGLKSYDFSGHRPIQSELNGLLSALRKMKDEFHSDPKENNMQSADRSRSGDSTDLEHVPIDGASFALDSEISPGNIIGAVGGVPLSPMQIDDSHADDADSASLASIESSSDDADTKEDAVETVDIVAGPITQEHINQARLCNVIVTLCADVLRDILLSQVPGGFTNIYSALLGSRTTLAAVKQIGQEQLKQIFPDPRSRYTGTVDQFDITLLYALIRSISSCPAPITGWGKPSIDQPRDVSLSANVERIRLLRNKVSGHSVDGKLDDQACEDYFGEIGQILNDVEAILGDKGYKDALDERRKQIITTKEAKVLRNQFESHQHQLKEDMKAVVQTYETFKEHMDAKVEQLSTAIAQKL